MTTVRVQIGSQVFNVMVEETVNDFIIKEIVWHNIEPYGDTTLVNMTELLNEVACEPFFIKLNKSVETILNN